jgi:hypothetical protein
MFLELGSNKRSQLLRHAVAVYVGGLCRWLANRIYGFLVAVAAGRQERAMKAVCYLWIVRLGL